MQKRIFQQRFLLLLVLVLALTANVACARESETAFERFQNAISSRNFVLAKDIYEDEASHEAFDSESYVSFVENTIQAIIDNYQNGTLSYDKAHLEVMSFDFAAEMDARVEEKLAQAHRIISPDNSIEQNLALAEVYESSGSYREALLIFNRILEEHPGHVKAEEGRARVIDLYSAQIQEEANAYLEGGYPRTALSIIQSAIESLGEREALLALQKKAEDASKAVDDSIREQVPVHDLNQFLAEDDIKGAEEYIEKLEEMDIDVEPYLQLIEEYENTQVALIMQEAENLAAANNGASRSLRNAVARVDEGLKRFPDNEELIAKRRELRNRLPSQVRASLYNISGSVTGVATGRDYAGNLYTADMEFPAFGIRPDASFTYNVGEYTNTQIILSPKTPDASVYAHYWVEVFINGEEEYSNMPFAIRARRLELNYSVPQHANVTITFKQSGLQSFFDGILDRNSLFAQIYLNP